MQAQRPNIVKHLLVTPRLAIQSVCGMVKNAEEEVGLDVVPQDGTPNPDCLLLRSTVLGELPWFLVC